MSEGNSTNPMTVETEKAIREIFEHIPAPNGVRFARYESDIVLALAPIFAARQELKELPSASDERLNLNYGVHFGNPNDAQSEVEREKISEVLDRMLETQRLEIKRLKAELAASGNYIADREVNPTTITFKNGRCVFLNSEGFLDVAAAPEAGAKEGEK